MNNEEITLLVAIVGFFGAIMGGVISLGGVWIAHSLQSRSEHKKWLLEHKQKSYTELIVALMKSLAQFSSITVLTERGLTQRQEFTAFIQSFYDKFNEIRSLVHILGVYSSDNQREQVENSWQIFSGDFVLLSEEYSNKEADKTDSEVAKGYMMLLSRSMLKFHDAIVEIMRNDLFIK